jgi:peptidoglycan/xylan/chitin deacetylase (PgdA/CDA1 family)
MKQKRIYLTIDDAPSDDFKKKVDFLHERKIQAIFFCLGKLLEEKEADILYAISKGFVIGNHSYNHPSFSKISLNEAKNQIKKTDSIINNLYKKAGIKRTLNFFRFPYGDKGDKNKEVIQDFLRKLNYKQPKFKGITYDYFYEFKLNKDLDVFWTFDFEEYSKKDWKLILEKMNCENPKLGGSLMNNNSSDIILIHDHTETTNIFFKIVEELLNRKMIFEKYE